MIKLEEYKREADGDASRRAKNFADVAFPSVSDFDYQVLKSDESLDKVPAGAKLPAYAANVGYQLLYFRMSRKTHKEKVKRVTDTLYKTDKERLSRDLCKAGIEIFHIFERTFNREFKSEGEMRTRLRLCAIEARDRIFNFAYRNINCPNSTVDLCIEGLWHGKSKSLSKKLMLNKKYVNVFDKLTQSLPPPQRNDISVGVIDLEQLVNTIYSMIN